MPSTRLDDRSLVDVSGPDARSFLQGLITCDMEKVSPHAAGFGALLTPQGKIITDFLIYEQSDGFLLDVPRAQLADLLKRLTLYKLRAKVSVSERADLCVVAMWDEVVAGTVADPRSDQLGSRLVVARDQAASTDMQAYEARRIEAGIPKGGVDFTYGDAFPHDVNMDLINGVDFRKGCYVGQEVVSRVQHRSTARRRILKLSFDGAAPAPGTPVMAGEIEIGVVGSSVGPVALVSVRTDKLEDARAAGVAASAGGVGLLP